METVHNETKAIVLLEYGEHAVNFLTEEAFQKDNGDFITESPEGGR